MIVRYFFCWRKMVLSLVSTLLGHAHTGDFHRCLRCGGFAAQLWNTLVPTEVRTRAGKSPSPLPNRRLVNRVQSAADAVSQRLESMPRKPVYTRARKLFVADSNYIFSFSFHSKSIERYLLLRPLLVCVIQRNL